MKSLSITALMLVAVVSVTLYFKKSSEQPQIEAKLKEPLPRDISIPDESQLESRVESFTENTPESVPGILSFEEEYNDLKMALPELDIWEPLAEEWVENPSFSSWKEKAEFKAVKNIKPPIPGVEPPTSVTILDKEVLRKGGVIDLGFGAFLRLPAGAFVDEAGKAIEEEVKLSYCQMSDPVDVYLSGIPMKYDSAGQSGIFQTAGMVRLEANTFSGKQVKLKEGTSLKLDMPTIDDASDYNFYAFNEASGAWEYESNAPQAQSIVDLMMDSTIIHYPFDTTSYALKFDNPAFHHLMHKDAKREVRRVQRTWFLSNQKGIISHCLYGKHYRQTNSIRLNPFTVLVGYTEDQKPIKEIRFEIGFNKNRQIEFRELRHFRNVQFTLDEVKDRRKFYEGYRRGRRFHDIKIDYQEGDDFCMLYLKDEEETIALKARICTGTASKLSNHGKTRFARKFARYKRDDLRKAGTHDKMIRERMTEHFLLLNQRYSRNGYWVEPGYRQLKIPSLGLFNCDRIRAITAPKPIKKEMQLEDGTPFLADKIELHDNKSGINLAFEGDEEAVCSRDGVAYIIYTRYNKKYYVRGRDYERFLRSKKKVLVVKELPPIQNAAALKQLLN